MLQLYGGRRLEPGQVAAIVHVVASSVPELEANEVTVVDQNGTLLSSPEDEEQFALTAKQFEYQSEIEHSYAQRIEDMLMPIVGAGRVRARVTADVDFTMTERTSEDYDPQKTAVRSEQTASEQRLPGDTGAGHPGRAQQSAAEHRWRAAGRAAAACTRDHGAHPGRHVAARDTQFRGRP